MGESAAIGSSDADGTDGSSSASTPDGQDAVPVVVVADRGDIILALTFETSLETLKSSRRTALGTVRKASDVAAAAQPLPTSSLRARARVAYRVRVDALRKKSRYFENLLSNARFREAQLVADACERFRAMRIDPREAAVADLPRIAIVDDDQATQAAGRELAFEDMLRIIHQRPPRSSRATLSYLSTLAIMADRFDCVGPVSRSLSSDFNFKWPVTLSKPYHDGQGRSTGTEQLIRQKVLVAWLLEKPIPFRQASRELIIRGSSLWSLNPSHDTSAEKTAVWWNLPDGLELELQHRRECVLNAIASVQRHFLQLYGSREHQCKLGYDSSAACDSFQLGQMLKFFLSKKLGFLVDFSPRSLESVPDACLLDIDDLLATLKQCPSYQIDKNHTNCGLRIRIDPILDYLRAMLSANTVAPSHSEWKKHRLDVSWVVSRDSRCARDEEPARTFSFTRSLASDDRLRFQGAIYADKMAKSLFTADSWDWTPEA